jgi:hypothetical protein
VTTGCPGWGQTEKFGHDQDAAALLPTADVSADSCHCRYVPILLQKSVAGIVERLGAISGGDCR